MTNDEINRKLAEFMGLCWHEGAENVAGYYHCPKCVQTISLKFGTGTYGLNPDYCSSDSPRSLLEGVVVNLLENETLAEGFIRNLCEDQSIDTKRWNNPDVAEWRRVSMTVVDAFMVATATAEQIAPACATCIRADGDESSDLD